jgi:DNA repair protein RadD
MRSRLPDPYIPRVTFDYSNIPDRDARDLQAAAARVRSLVRMMTADIIEVGKELLHAKSKLKRGQFGAWLEAEFTMTDRTAQNYMRAAERFGDKSEIVSLLQPSAVYILAALSTPESATDDVIRRVERGEPMSPAAVRLVVNNAKFEQRSAQAKAKRALEEAKLSPRARKSREEKRQERERQRQDIERERNGRLGRRGRFDSAAAAEVGRRRRPLRRAGQGNRLVLHFGGACRAVGQDARWAGQVTAELRPYQADVVARLEAAIAAGRRRLLVVMPTGSGKTVVIAALVARAQRRRVLFLAHRRELIAQASVKLHAAAVDHGVIAAEFPTRPAVPVQVASIATLHARAIRTRKIDLPGADLVIIDEAHHCRASSYRAIVERYPQAVILGVTATPCRGDGRGLGGTFETLIEGPTVDALIKEGYLVPTKVYAPSRPDLNGVRVERGDYVEKQLAERMDTGVLVGDIVEHWLRLAQRRRTVVFATGVAHSVHIRDEFRRTGVWAEHVDGSTPVDERDQILAKLVSGSVEVVSNAMVLTEGWDAPEVSCLVLARPTRQIGLYRQMAGRILRPAPGKSDALILDHAGAVFTHGFPEDRVAWTLAPDRHAENTEHRSRGLYKVPGLTTCPECHAVRFEGRPCSLCGWRRRTRGEAVEVTDGELAAVDRQRRTRAPVYDADDMHRFHRMLAWVARERGYKPGWAVYKFKEKFGTWPVARSVAPLEPDDATLAWVRSRQIAYAKATAKQRGAA